MGKDIKTIEDFKAFTQEVENQEGYRKPAAFGIGLAHLNVDTEILDTFFPFPNYQQNYGSAAVMAHTVGHLNGTHEYLVGGDQVEMILSRFAPFRNDGKRHGNIDAVKDMFSVAKGMHGANATKHTKQPHLRLFCMLLVRAVDGDASGKRTLLELALKGLKLYT